MKDLTHVGKELSQPHQPDSIQAETADPLTSFIDSIFAVNDLNGHLRQSWTLEGSEQIRSV